MLSDMAHPSRDAIAGMAELFSHRSRERRSPNPSPCRSWRHSPPSEPPTRSRTWRSGRRSAAARAHPHGSSTTKSQTGSSRQCLPQRRHINACSFTESNGAQAGRCRCERIRTLLAPPIPTPLQRPTSTASSGQAWDCRASGAARRPARRQASHSRKRAEHFRRISQEKQRFEDEVAARRGIPDLAEMQ